jgi:hypothetical protein
MSDEEIKSLEELDDVVANDDPTPLHQEVQYVDFDCEVVAKDIAGLTIRYSRNGEDGELDKSFFAESTFTIDQVDNFAKVKKGKGVVRIEHGPLTDELLEYEDNKKPVE